MRALATPSWTTRNVESQMLIQSYIFYILQVDAIKLREQDRIYLYAGTNYSVTGTWLSHNKVSSSVAPEALKEDQQLRREIPSCAVDSLLIILGLTDGTTFSPLKLIEVFSVKLFAISQPCQI